MIQNGNLIRLNLNGSLIAKLMSLDMNMEREMLDKTDKYSNEWKAIQPGNKSFTLSCEGFVVDPYDKNMIVYSENFEHSSWVKTGFTLSPTLVNDPNGFKRAYQSVNGSSGDTLSVTPISTSTTASYTFSIWLKAVTGTVDMIMTLDNGTDTDYNNITLTTTWTRYTSTITATIVQPLVCQLEFAQNAQIQMYGAQLEFGRVATAYEPTGVRFTELFNAVENGTQFTAIVTDATTGNKNYEGAVQVSSLSLTAPQGQLCTFSCELIGNSALTENTI